MTIVILSKNGEIFLPKCLESLRNTTDDPRIIITDNGYSDKNFLAEMIEKYNIEVITNPKNTMYSFLDTVIDIDKRIFIMHDSIQVKSRKYFDDLLSINKDIASWVVLPDHYVGATSIILAEMKNFLPEELWILPGSTITLGYYSMEFIKLLRSDKTILEYCKLPIEPFGHVLERLLPSYFSLVYGSTYGWVTTYEKLNKGHYKGLNFIESETAIKYQGSSLLGANRDRLAPSGIFMED